jgi:hypothetical protein
MSKEYGIKNFVRIANEYMNPNELNSLESITKFLIGWFCVQFNTTFLDPRLQELTTEELLVLYNMYRIKEDPNYVTEVLSPSKDNYEEWLKREMGEDYASEEQNIKQLEAEEKEFTKKVREKFPDKITTSFVDNES